jgi:hypothetical protein
MKYNGLGVCPQYDGKIIYINGMTLGKGKR